MPIATQTEIREASAPLLGEAARGFTDSPLEVLRAATRVPDRASRLQDLLAEDPVDLARVSNEIRSVPTLATAVTRVAASLKLLPDASACSVEEAAVVLGTEWLRVLLHSWQAFESSNFRLTAGGPEIDGKIAAANSHASDGAPETEAPDGGIKPLAPESLYLASFMQFLGLAGTSRLAFTDARASAPCSGAHISELAEILVRDFVALLPALDPQLLRTLDPPEVPTSNR